MSSKWTAPTQRKTDALVGVQVKCQVLNNSIQEMVANDEVLDTDDDDDKDDDDE